VVPGVTVHVLQSNPSFVPTLEIYNAKEKPMSIDRDGRAVMVNPSSSSELRSGDKVNIVVGVSVECVLSP
jgi:methionine aminopeptidase